MPFINSTEHAHGRVINASTRNGSPNLSVPRVVTDHRLIGPSFTALLAVIDSAANTLNGLRHDRTDDGLSKEAKKLLGSLLAKPVSGAQKSLTSAQRARAEGMEEIDTVPPAVSVSDAMLRTEWRTYIGSVSLAERFRVLSTANLTALRAVVEGGRELSGLPPDLWEKIVERHRMLAHIERAKVVVPLKPTPDHVAPIGNDEAAALAIAAEALKAFEQDGETLALAEQVLQQTVRFFAAITNSHPDAVLKELLA